MTPLVSIIVPVYKAEKYLSECIDSILVQTYSQFELILVDDGSPDKSSAICDEYAKKDNRIQVIHKENGGVSSARNEGIEKSNGEWLCFIDSDDIIVQTYIEDFGLTKIACDWYMQGYKKIKSNRVIETHDFFQCKDSEYWNILAFSENNCIINSPCFKLYKRSIIVDNDIKFDLNTSYGEDHLFSLDYAIHVQSIHYTKAAGYLYRLSDSESLTQRIVPYQEITYYALQARVKQESILQKGGTTTYLESIDKTLLTNFIRTLKFIFYSNAGYKVFSEVINQYKSSLNSVIICSLSTFYKIILILVKINLIKLLYPIFNIMLRQKT